jgi:hypothetical protein
MGSFGFCKPPKHAFTISIGSKSGDGRIGSTSLAVEARQTTRVRARRTAARVCTRGRSEACSANATATNPVATAILNTPLAPHTIYAGGVRFYAGIL